MSLSRFLGILCLLACTEPYPAVLFAQRGDCSGLNMVRLGEIPGLGFIRGFADLNHNGLVDIVGSGPPLGNPNGGYRLKIFEYTGDNRYARQVYEGRTVLGGFDHPEWIGDSDGDGLVELAISHQDDRQNLFVYESLDSLSYPIPDSINLKWQLRMWDFGFLVRQTVYDEDLDNDGLREFVFGFADSVLQEAAIFIWEWDGRSGYKEVGRLIVGENYGDKIFGDFDMDGFKEIIVGDTRGVVHGFETADNDSFYQHWTGKAFVQNAMRGVAINDADQDGKPEFVIGAASFEHGYKLYTMFETISNNQYEIVWQDTLCEFPLGFGKMVAGDVDDDGVDEFVIASESNLRVYNAVADNNFQCVFIMDYGGSDLDTYDANNNGYSEILYGTHPHQLLEYVPVTAVGGESVYSFTTSFELYRNYPNPFNSSTTIAFCLRFSARVQLTIYDIFGREVETLVNELKPPGYHIVKWSAITDNEKGIASGIYFYSLSVDKSTRTAKMILLR